MCRVWTIQPLSALEEIRKTGTYRCREELSYNLSKQNSLKPSYRWLIKEMEMRIGGRPEGVEYPIWAWHTWDFNRRCPEVDSAAFLKRTEEKVLLTLEIPERDLVLTDFDAWQIVMMDSYLMDPADAERADEVEVYLDTLQEKAYAKEVSESWKRVFNTAPLDIDGWQRGRYIQATFWEIREAYIQDCQVLFAEQ